MCSIIVKKRGVEVTPQLWAAIVNISKSHVDGLGFAIKKDGCTGVHIRKGFHNPLLCIAKIRLFYPKKNDEIMIHARTGTSGEKTKELCHPFIISDRQSTILTTDGLAIKTPVMAHNGVMFNFIEMGSKYSDTYHFIKQWLADEDLLKEFMADPNLFTQKYKSTIGHQRLSFMFPQSTTPLFLNGNWHEDWGGLLFSNGSFRNGSENLTKGQISLLNKYADIHKKKKGTPSLFTDNPVKTAMDIINKPNTLQLPAHMANNEKKKEEKPVKPDTRTFSMKLPENYIENLKKEAKEEKEKKQKAARATNSGLSSKNSTTHSSIGEQGPAVRKGSLSKEKEYPTQDGIVISDELKDCLTYAQRMVNYRGAKASINNSYRGAVNKMNFKYLHEWLYNTIEVYIEYITPQNYHHFMFYSSRTTSKTKANSLYEIKYSSLRKGKNIFTIVKHGHKKTEGQPISAEDIYSYGTLIPKPSYASVYAGIIALFNEMEVPSKSFLKNLNKKMANASRNRHAGVFIERMNKTINLHAINFYLEQNANIYDVAKQHKFVELPVI